MNINWNIYDFTWQDIATSALAISIAFEDIFLVEPLNDEIGIIMEHYNKKLTMMISRLAYIVKFFNLDWKKYWQRNFGK